MVSLVLECLPKTQRKSTVLSISLLSFINVTKILMLFCVIIVLFDLYAALNGAKCSRPLELLEVRD